MKKVNLIEAGEFNESSFKRFLVHDSPYMKILNFNFQAGQELPVHSHNMEGQVSMTILEGEGEFLCRDGALPAKAGDVLISEISEPHGLRAKTDCGFWWSSRHLFKFETITEWPYGKASGGG